MFLVRKKHRIKKVYLFQKVYLLRGFLKSRVGNDAEHICDLDHPYLGWMWVTTGYLGLPRAFGCVVT